MDFNEKIFNHSWKKSLQKIIEGVYNQHKEELGYEADFTFLNSPVSHISDKCLKVDLNNGEWVKLKINSINIPEGYYMVNTSCSKEQLNKIKDLINTNKYDYVINACDPDLYGQLLYEKTKEVLDITIQDKRMVYNDLTDTHILKALQEFKSNNDYRKKVLKSLIL